MAREIPQRGGALQVARRWRWLLVGGVGLAFWVAFLVLSAIFGLDKMGPTILVLGSLLVPVTIVIWNLDHLADATLTGERVLFAFMGGGLLGLVLAFPINRTLVPAVESVAGVWGMLAVGLTEEAAKLVGLVLFSIGMVRYTTRNGVVLGSAVGFAFAALETAGYASVTLPEYGLWQNGGVVGTLVSRSLAAPVLHGLYTAIMGAALFHAARGRGHLRITWVVVGVYLWVSLLHGLWNVVGDVQIPPALSWGYAAALAAAGVATLLAMWRIWVAKEDKRAVESP
ncbi:MAG: PrsW family intramembrane metalloprotease [Candidatus Dormibacteraeota bacterium]|nr:PrsW family intramembrane metalloprotease [Candidatus Dormibacteraeota bacterium]